MRQSARQLPVMALTATASVRVREDIKTSLALKDPLELLASFNRPNIEYSIQYCESAPKVRSLLTD